MRIATLALILLLPWPALALQPADPPVTIAEQTDYRKTGTSAQVQAFLQALHDQSERTWLGSIGNSHEGKPLSLLVVADPPVTSAEEARRSGKLVVLLFGNIHSGETCGKEALQMLARELALGERPDLLDDLVVCFVPNYNPDSNDKMDPGNRRNQNGPDEMGQRHNAQDLDLNRDWIKMEAPETRALVRFMHQWDPAVIVDSHTTNGSNHRYVITHQGPKHPSTHPGLLEFSRETFIPEIDERFEAQTGYDAWVYGNFADGHTRWTTYPASPRYGTPYRGLRNRIGILSEAYAYASFEDRVLGTLEFCRAVLQESAEHADAIREVVAAADEHNRSGDASPVALRSRAIPFRERFEALGYVEYDDEGNKIEATDEPRDYQVELVNDFEATVTVDRPWAYLVPADLAHVARHLQRHGVEVREVREDMDLDVRAYRIDSMRRAEREFQGHRMLDVWDVTEQTLGVRIEAGWHLVRTEQPLGTLAAYMLEPQSTDGLTAWNFLDGHVEEGGRFPIYRLPEAAPILTRSAQPLDEFRDPPKRITSEMIIDRQGVPNLNGAASARLDWIDDEHLSKSVPGIPGRFKIDARTGRVIEQLDESAADAVAAVIAELPTISEGHARRVASSAFRTPREDGLVFEHEQDLYYVSADDSSAVRLTATPQREESWSLSPDGRFVAYVHDNDLWVVDVATQTPRALTEGGSDDVRNGKASWLYFEELFGRSWKAYWWSPDSVNIAFLITDSTAVPTYTIVDNQRREQRIEVERYARPGERNPDVELGFVSPEGGRIRLADLSAYDEGQFLISGVSWTPDGRRCIVHVQDRIQTWLDVLHVSPRNGSPSKLMRDRTEAWITSPGDFIYLDDGSFLMFSERDGFKHLYHYSARGQIIRQVTSGDWECQRVLHVDEEGGWLYFAGTTYSHVGSDLSKIRLDGTELTRLTHEPGTHSVSLNPSATMFIDRWSGVNQPNKVALRSTEDGALIRWLDTNPVYELQDYQLATLEHAKIPSRRPGVELEAIVHYPPDFDADETYPLWVMTYAGPHAPTVRDSWRGGRTWEQLLCSAGIVVLRVDPYAASGKGARSAWTSYLNLGVGELQDLEDAVGWAIDQGWADPSRVGISGHSFGGYITAYALTHSDLFTAGISGAPVTDWRDYDTIYTERYMSTPQANPEGYERTSAVEGAANLSGRLLLVHGAIDDNVHAQNSLLFADALQRAGKLFEMAIYPGSRHGIWSRQYRHLQWEFIKRTMDVDEPSQMVPSHQDSRTGEQGIEVAGDG
ncbi:MAG: DPP IV N-terminal domain-containing protein [Phycisphaerales bacterium]|jgi:dipeptidyl-peptidase-4